MTKQHKQVNKIIEIFNRKYPGVYIEAYQDYGEPGYENNDKPIFTGDWNNAPSKFTTWLEDNYNIEWSDEWTSCHECGKLIRTSPNSYSWTKSYSVLNDGELFCQECIINQPEKYIEELINNPEKVNTLDELKLNDYGFEDMNGTFESGFYNTHDNPKDILKEFLNKYPSHEFIFNNLSSEQFRINFEIWGREKDII